MTAARLPTYFISHGGGPWPYVESLRLAMRQLELSLLDIPRQLGTQPAAILMISGHWEAAQFSVMTHPQPPMLYDYSGFPPHTYSVRYAAPGSPRLAQRVYDLLTAQNIVVERDAERGFDHGAFTPLAVMYPEANVPVVQLSLQAGYDPARHLAAGRALAPLRDEDILIIGSGLSYHNLRNFGAGAKQASKTFDTWLQATLLSNEAAARTTGLMNWSQAPAARLAHPQADHLLPLMVALGAAENEDATLVYHEENLFGGVTASSFRFGSVPH